MKSKTTNLNVANYRSVIRAAAILILTMICGGLCAQTVSISPKTGNVISASSYGTESHQKGFGGAWVHNQLPLTLITSDEATLKESGLMSVHANNVSAQDGKLIIISGEGNTCNHMSLSLPKGYRFTSYKMVINSNNTSVVSTTLKEMDATFTDTKESVTIQRTGSTGITMQRTSMNNTDMGNIWFFR